MASIDFPNSPTIGDVFTAGSVAYRWNGTAWLSAESAAPSYNDLLDVPLVFPPEAHTHVMADITDYTPPGLENHFMLMGA